MSISLVIPCRNESGHIAKIIRTIPDAIEQIVLVNNNSTDETLSALSNIAKTDKRVLVIDEPREQGGIGYGYAHMAGLKAAFGDYIVCLDGDGSYPIESIAGALDKARLSKSDVLSCSRYPIKKGSSFNIVAMMGAYLFSLVIVVLFNRWINDSLSGMWVIKRSSLERLNLTSGDWNFSLEIKLKAILDSDLKFEEYPLMQQRRYGKSKQDYIKTGFNHLAWLVRYHLKVK